MQATADSSAGYWIIEVLDIVLSRLKLDNLTEEENATLRQFFNLIRQIEKIKQNSNPAKLTLGNVDRMIDDIRALRKIDEKVYTEIVSRIKDAFCANDKTILNHMSSLSLAEFALVTLERFLLLVHPSASR